MVTNTNALLQSVIEHWGSTPSHENVQGEPVFTTPIKEKQCAHIGAMLLGKESEDINRDAQRIVTLVRNYPIRPYRITGGGTGIYIPTGWAAIGNNWEIFKEFSDLWWTAAGDAVLERYKDRLPRRDRDTPSLCYGAPDDIHRQHLPI